MAESIIAVKKSEIAKMEGWIGKTDANTIRTSDGFKKDSAFLISCMHSQMIGDADVDFCRSMIPHHQSAIDMAKVELNYGQDLEMKRLATRIIAEQEKEIAMMLQWLKKKGM